MDSEDAMSIENEEKDGDLAINASYFVSVQELIF
jgi:hypothetical protein